MEGYQIVVLFVVLGSAIGAFLAYSSKVFYVKKEEKLVELESLMPGANCGACGYPGCSGLAEAIFHGEAQIESCTVASAEAKVKMAEVMGKQFKADLVRNVAYVRCKGTTEEVAGAKFEYIGIDSCVMASQVNGGWKLCEYGCLMKGDCVAVCKFEALYLDDNGFPTVNAEKCTSCGLCVLACPRNMISMIPYKKTYVVSCVSKDKGPITRKNCKVGCIACGLCVKACKYGAITILDNLAVIDQNKCTACGACALVCPQKTIDFVDIAESTNIKIEKSGPCSGCSGCGTH